MGSKLFFLGILLAMVLISSDAARQLAKETTINAFAPSPVNDAKYASSGGMNSYASSGLPKPIGGFSSCYKCCSWSYYYGYRCRQCCSSSAAQP